MALLTTICAAMLAVGIAPGAAAAPTPTPERACDTAKAPLLSTVDGRTLWKYTHIVDYCADGAKITDVQEPKVEVEIFDPSCTWDGVQDRSSGEVGGESADTFSMGLMTCDPADAEPYQVNPWVILTVQANGNHSARTGIEPR